MAPRSPKCRKITQHPDPSPMEQLTWGHQCQLTAFGERPSNAREGESGSPFAANGPVPSRRRPGATARLPCHRQHRLQQTPICRNRRGSFCSRPLSAAEFRRSLGRTLAGHQGSYCAGLQFATLKHRALTHRSTMAHIDPPIAGGSRSFAPATPTSIPGRCWSPKERMGNCRLGP
jgi:hypothetical protein